MNTSENLFRLLVPATEQTSSDAPSVELCGSRWRLAEFASISDAPPYTCISYSWGVDRTENMFEDGQLMSTRTIPVIESVIKIFQSPGHWIDALTDATGRAMAIESLKAQAFWIDALCVPQQEPARTACLQSMGVIYSSATQAFAVLSQSCCNLFRRIHKTGHMNSEDFFVLDADDWITRAWTYQEIANSLHTFFIAQGDNCVIHELDFLNVISTDTNNYADAQSLGQARVAVQFPKLDRLQELLAEHHGAAFSERSAYQVMSAMHQRYSEREEDRIYAMIGVIANSSQDNLNDVSLHPAEYFMRLCEAKGDYSFIYSVAPRSEVLGRGWRPVAGQISPVLSGILAFGSGQHGCLKATHLQMDNICRMNPGTLDSLALKAIEHFLQRGKIGSLTDLTDAVLERLRQKGFSGCGEYLELENGYFFPLSPLKRTDNIFVVSSNDLIWPNGGPSLLVRSNSTDINQFCDAGVFVGRFPKTSESINVG